MAQITKKTISIRDVDPILIFGYNDNYLKLIEERFAAKIIARGDSVYMEGEEDEVARIENIFSELIFLLHRNKYVDKDDVLTVLNLAQTQAEPSNEIRDELDSVVLFTTRGYVKPRTDGQRRYFQALKKNEIVVAIGPAGTGKTYLAVAAALAGFKEKQVKKIILARPAVEAGESLGFLPGDLREKVDPYLRPLFDALSDMLPADRMKGYIEKQTIEVVPLAYMRGRTLDNAYLILDEAQNTTTLQMKMFLTRIGVNSKAIITGDITQIDLMDTTNSGLIQIQTILKGIEGIEFVYLDKKDVVRHRLVKDIIQAYDQHTGNGNNKNPL